MNLYGISIDIENSLYLICYERINKNMKEGNTSYLDILWSEYENYDNFYSDIAQAYQNIKFNTCKFDFFLKSWIL